MASKAMSEDQFGKHVLYLTISHHTERTTRVYAEDFKTGEGATGSETSYFYSADVVTVDLERGILSTKIGRRQIQHEDDPIAGNPTLALQDHYRYILDQVNYGIGRPPGLKTVILENDWTLNLESRKVKCRKKGAHGHWAEAGSEH